MINRMAIGIQLAVVFTAASTIAPQVVIQSAYPDVDSGIAVQSDLQPFVWVWGRETAD